MLGPEIRHLEESKKVKVEDLNQTVA